MVNFSRCRPTGPQCRKTAVFGGAPGTDGRSRLRRIAWTPSVVREAEIVALGSPKAVRIGWMTTLAFRHMSLGQPVGRPPVVVGNPSVGGQCPLSDR